MRSTQRSSGGSRPNAARRSLPTRFTRWAQTARGWRRSSTIRRRARVSWKPPTARSRDGSIRQSTTSVLSSLRRTGEDCEDALASVNVTINGRQFRIGCEDGQEQHIEKLAVDFDALISDLRGRIGEVGDARLTIMAALTVADDLSEATKKIRGLEAELSALKEATGRVRRPQSGDPGRRGGGIQCRRGAARRGGQEAEPVDWRSRARARLRWRRGLAQTTLARRGCPVRLETIPRGLTILKGAVPGWTPGSGYMAPTYFCRFPGSALRRPVRLRTSLAA